jgi:hypothetical protein
MSSEHATEQVPLAKIREGDMLQEHDVSVGGIHAVRPGSWGHRSPRVSMAMAISASGL